MDMEKYKNLLFLLIKMLKIPKKWRELPIREKLLIPEKVFNIDKKEIERVRNISNPKRKLIAAAKLQYNLFGDIHSYLTIWIAGYASDIIVRYYFGSTKNLLQIFMKDISSYNKVDSSWADMKRRIKIPRQITGDLAEETGIHIGDGNLSIREDKNGAKSYNYCITGDLANEFIYHTEHIAKLMKKIYNINSKFMKRHDKNSIESKYSSKAIVKFKNDVLNLPAGPKKNIHIPKSIFENDELAKRCIAGIIDTDFNVTSSLSISGKLHSLFAADEIHLILERLKVTHVYRKYRDYGRFYIPQKESEKIVRNWRLHNPKHLTKFSVFEKFGKFIPFTTTSERIDLLDGRINLPYLEKISAGRRLNKMPISSYDR